jgi:peptidoglycan/xylan/chitin deacetylase (PgdA/CDA1 family)
VAGYGKWFVALVLWATGVLRILRTWRARHGEIPVLLFHRIGGTYEAPAPLSMPADAFRALVTAAARRYLIAPWQACVKSSRARRGRPHLALTFDDGYRDNARCAWPMVRQSGATAMFFITTGFTDGTEVPWWHVAAAYHTPLRTLFPCDWAGEATYGEAAEAEITALKAMPHANFRRRVAEMMAQLPSDASPPAELMSWNEIRQLAAEGAEIGAHSVTHPILTNCTDAEIEAELRGCRERLRTELAREVSLFAYPNGDCDARLTSLTAAVGYRFAFTTERRYFNAALDPLRVPRIPVTRRLYSPDGIRFSWALFEAELLGAFDWLLLRRWRDRRRGARRAIATDRVLTGYRCRRR